MRIPPLLRLAALSAAMVILSGCILDLDRSALLDPDAEDEAIDHPESFDAANGDRVEAGEDPGFEEPEAACPASEHVCLGGMDEDCDGEADCEDPDCLGEACYDGDICTYDDLCTSGGSCRGTAVVCESDACVSRICNGSSSCTVTPNDGAGCDDDVACTYDDRCLDGTCRGTPIDCPSDACTTRACNGTSSCTVTHAAWLAPCPDDGNVCTGDACDGAGTCLHPGLADGTSCGGLYEQRCCGTACVNIFSDDGNCGGCGISCQGRGCVILPGTSFAGCPCTANAQCRVNGPEWTCYNTYCNCQADGDCAAGQTCQEPSGHNWCQY